MYFISLVKFSRNTMDSTSGAFPPRLHPSILIGPPWITASSSFPDWSHSLFMDHPAPNLALSFPSTIQIQYAYPFYIINNIPKMQIGSGSSFFKIPHSVFTDFKGKASLLQTFQIHTRLPTSLVLSHCPNTHIACNGTTTSKRDWEELERKPAERAATGAKGRCTGAWLSWAGLLGLQKGSGWSHENNLGEPQSICVWHRPPPDPAYNIYP